MSHVVFDKEIDLESFSLCLLILFVVYQPKNVIPYSVHDDSVKNYFTKINVEPYKGRKNYLFQV